MRRIETKGAERKRRKRNRIIVSLILIFVMFSSVIGYSFLNVVPQPEDTDYQPIPFNGYEFYYQNGLWLLEIEGTTFGFLNHPNSIDLVSPYVVLKDLSFYEGNRM